MLYCNGEKLEQLYYQGKPITSIYKNGVCIYPGNQYSIPYLISDLGSVLENIVTTEVTALLRSNVPLSEIPDIKNVTIINDITINKTPIYIGISEENHAAYWYSVSDIVKSNIALKLGSNNYSNNITDISGISNWDISSTTDMSGLLKHMRIRNVDSISNWDISKVTNISHAFFFSAISDLSGIANWNTSNITNMNSAFSLCSGVTQVSDLRSWDTSNVSDMSFMFEGDQNLIDITGLSEWNTSQVYDMSDMFASCRKLTTLDGLSKWDTSNVQNMHDIFGSCDQLSDITAIADWDTGNVTDMSNIFMICPKLTSLQALSDWDTHSVTNLHASFLCMYALSDISALSDWDVSSVTTINQIFQQDSALSDISALSNWGTNYGMRNLTSMSNAFDRCTSLTDVSALYTWDLSNRINFYHTFQYTKITKFDFSYFTHMQLSNLCATFYSCTALTICDLGSYIETVKTYMSGGRLYGTFGNCSSLHTLIIRRTDAVISGPSEGSSYSNAVFNGASLLRSSSGKLYVPEDMVNLYKTDSFWKIQLLNYGCKILPLEGSPYEEPGSI